MSRLVDRQSAQAPLSCHTEEPAALDAGWGPADFVVHRRILEAGIPLVEGLVSLDQLPARCEFFAPFSKLGGIEATPARAFARIDGAPA